MLRSRFDARQELGLSRTARTDRDGYTRAHSLSSTATGAQARGVPAGVRAADAADAMAIMSCWCRRRLHSGWGWQDAACRHHGRADGVHHPTDTTRLWDVVRVVIACRPAPDVISGFRGFPNRRRAARRRMLAIQRMTTTRNGTRGKTANIASSSALPRSRGVRAIGARDTSNARGKDLLSTWQLRSCERDRPLLWTG